MEGTVQEMLARHDANFKAMEAKDKAAKLKGELLGRFIAESIADGRAFYEVVKVNKATVSIRWVEAASLDDYQVPYWGEEATIKRSYAEQSIERRDKLAAMFGRGA